MEYTVISRRILTGTVSDLPPAIRLAWIAVLFEAERLRGRVKLPVRDLAKMASIATAEAAEALRVFQEPDLFSSSKEDDGRRLRAIPGEEDWYQVVTWEKHAAEREAFFNRLRQQRYRERHAVTVSNGALRQVTKEPEPEPEPEPKEESKALFADAHEKTSSKKRTRVSAKEKVEAYIAAGLSQKMILYARKYGVDASEAWDIWVLHIRGTDYRVGRNPCGDPESAFMYWMRTDAKRKKENASRFQQPATRHIARAPEPGKENW